MRKYLTLAEAAQLLPHRPAASTLWRWSVKGFYIRAVDEIIRLQHVHIGRRIFTTRGFPASCARIYAQWHAGLRTKRNKRKEFPWLCSADLAPFDVTGYVVRRRLAGRGRDAVEPGCRASS